MRQSHREVAHDQRQEWSRLGPPAAQTQGEDAKQEEQGTGGLRNDDDGQRSAAAEVEYLPGEAVGAEVGEIQIAVSYTHLDVYKRQG